MQPLCPDNAYSGDLVKQYHARALMRTHGWWGVTYWEMRCNGEIGNEKGVPEHYELEVG